MKIKNLIFWASLLAPVIVMAGPVKKMTDEEKATLSKLLDAHYNYFLRKPATGCYDNNGSLHTEGKKTIVDGFSFTCITPSESQKDQIYQSGKGSGVSFSPAMIRAWFPTRAADYCSENFKGNLEGCIKVLRAD